MLTTVFQYVLHKYLLNGILEESAKIGETAEWL